MGPQCQHFAQTSVPEPRLPARTLRVGSRGRGLRPGRARVAPPSLTHGFLAALSSPESGPVYWRSRTTSWGRGML